jgi:tetratricopeptide (TPR) repeat protein
MVVTPAIPDDVTGSELDRDVRMALSGLSSFTAKEVARHLVMIGRLIDDDPEAAWQHALAARARAARIGVVREAAGLAAYRAGHYAEALAELRTARRLTGSDEHLPVMADCERALGRSERALAMAAAPELGRLAVEQRVEMLIVEAGARADLGQLDAAVITLQVGLLDSRAGAPWVARLRSAYADALAAVGRADEARHWLERAAEADPDDQTGVGERLAELDGLFLEDLEEDAEVLEEGAEEDGEDLEEGADDLDLPAQDGDVDAGEDEGGTRQATAPEHDVADEGHGGRD